MYEDLESKTLIIYVGDSYYKYYNLFVEHLYDVNDAGHIVVYEREPHTGEEKVRAHFRMWDYFIIE